MTATNPQYLLFTLNSSRYAIELSQTAEVEDLPQTWPIPDSPAFFCGAMNFHNSIVAVADLAIMLGLPQILFPDKVIVLDPAVASMALRVERTLRITQPGEASLHAHPDDRFISATLVTPDGQACLLDIPALVEYAAENI